MKTLILASAAEPEFSDIWAIGKEGGIAFLGVLLAIAIAIFGVILVALLIFHTLQFFGIAPRGISFHGWIRKKF